MHPISHAPPQGCADEPKETTQLQQTHSKRDMAHSHLGLGRAAPSNGCSPHTWTPYPTQWACSYPRAPWCRPDIPTCANTHYTARQSTGCRPTLCKKVPSRTPGNPGHLGSHPAWDQDPPPQGPQAPYPKIARQHPPQSPPLPTEVETQTPQNSNCSSQGDARSQ